MALTRNIHARRGYVCRALTAFLILSAASLAQADEIDDYVRAQIKARNIPGISIAVVRDGKLVKAQGYGMANLELSSPATENTVYQLASVTKQFTATAIMMLVEEGKLSLDDKVTAILEGLPATWSNVTLRHLLNHTSGIKSYTNLEGFSKNVRKDYTPQEIVKLVADAPLEFAPGDKWAYNNTGYVLLGMIIEKVSGKSYGALVKERIFQPLEMTSTRMNDLGEIIPNRAHGYSRQPSGLRNGDYTSPTQPFSAGGLITTVVDLAKWDAAINAGKLLKPATVQMMWTPAKLNDGKTHDYGFGWDVSALRSRKRISHGGGIPGFSTYVERFVDDKLTVIALANLEGARTDAIAHGVAEFYLPELRTQAAKPIADKDPESSAHLKRVIATIAGGTADPNWFTPDGQKFFFPDRVKQGKDMFGSYGEMRSFDLMEESTQGDFKVRSYDAVFGVVPVNFTFRLTADGKIAAIRVMQK